MHCLFDVTDSGSNIWIGSRIGQVRGFSTECKHAPMRIAHPFIMIVHVIGSLGNIHEFKLGVGPRFATTFSWSAGRSRSAPRANYSGRLRKRWSTRPGKDAIT